MEGALLNMLVLSMFACFVTSLVSLGQDCGCYLVNFGRVEATS